MRNHQKYMDVFDFLSKKALNCSNSGHNCYHASAILNSKRQIVSYGTNATCCTRSHHSEAHALMCRNMPSRYKKGPPETN